MKKAYELLVDSMEDLVFIGLGCGVVLIAIGFGLMAIGMGISLLTN